MHSCRYHSNVQDPRSQLFDHGLFAFGSVPRRNQVWRLPSHHHWYAHERLFLVYLSCQGKFTLRVDIVTGANETYSLWRSYRKNDLWATSSTSTSSFPSCCNSQSTSSSWSTLLACPNRSKTEAKSTSTRSLSRHFSIRPFISWVYHNKSRLSSSTSRSASHSMQNQS